MAYMHTQEQLARELVHSPVELSIAELVEGSTTCPERRQEVPGSWAQVNCTVGWRPREARGQSSVWVVRSQGIGA